MAAVAAEALAALAAAAAAADHFSPIFRHLPKFFFPNFFFQACKTTLTLFAELDEIKFLQKYFFPLLASSFFCLEREN